VENSVVTPSGERVGAQPCVIDADGHIEELDFDSWIDDLPEALRPFAPHYETDPTGHRVAMIGSQRWRAQDANLNARTPAGSWSHREGMADPHKRIPDMDQMGIGISVLYGGSIFKVVGIVADPQVALAYCQRYNDRLAAYCMPYSERLKGVAAIPTLDPQASVTELRRAVVDLGMVGALLPTHEHGRTLDDPAFHPIYEEAGRLNVPLCVHLHWPINPSVDHFHNHIVRHTFAGEGVMFALGDIVIGGVLEDFPQLKFVFLEVGVGWLPYVMERLDSRYELLPHLAPKLTMRPSDYVRGQRLFFAADPAELTLPTVVELVGSHNIVLGSDYAHWDGTAPESINILRARNDLSPEVKRKILCENPARLYGL
jgi:uncharacterized protein